MESYPIRTDLALESQECLKRDRGNVRGIRFFEEKRKMELLSVRLLSIRKMRQKRWGGRKELM